MGKKNKIYMPMGMGGLFRFEEEEKHLIKLKPVHLIYITIGVIAVEVLLRMII
ncbi:MAG: preprotein translocase subunit Sec61beta [Candidatus Aenigmarchaeota archaeon]|nr:preprotein translocase subunit Sec61beta [Candidatus Aenigmarchaeota archaeon]